MNCENVRERLVELHEGLLAADDAPEVRAHVASCAECRGVLTEIAALHGRLERLGSAEGTVRGAGNGAGSATMVGELTMLRIAARRPRGFAGLRRALRWGVPLAAAACIGIAVALNLIAPQNAAARSLVQMAENVKKAGTVAFTITMTLEPGGQTSLLNPPMTMRLTALHGRWFRMEDSVFGTVVIGDLEKRSALMLNTKGRTARLRAIKGNETGWDVYDELVNLGKREGQQISEEIIEGEATRVVRIIDPTLFGGKGSKSAGDDHIKSGQLIDQRVWIGVASGLPVRAQWRQRFLIDDGTTQDMTIVLSRFEFDVEHDAALFSLEPPAGYDVEGARMEPKAALDLATDRMRQLAGALRGMRQSRGFWPAILAHLAGDADFPLDAVRNPRRPTSGLEGFVYFRPVDGMLSDEGVLFEPPCAGEGCVDGWSGSALVGYLDGRVEEVKDRVRYEAMLQRARQRVKDDAAGYNERLRRLNEQRQPER